jgi:hypothetical protein
VKREKILGIRNSTREKSGRYGYQKKLNKYFHNKAKLYEERKKTIKQEFFSVENYFLLEYKIAATVKSTDARAISGNA